MKSTRIAALLRQALIEDGTMAQSLYEYELEEHIDYWYEGLKADRDEYVFAVTENSGHVAMVLILADKTVLVNEAARAKLSEFWESNYTINMKRLIPLIAEDLADDTIFVNGVRTIDPKPPKRTRRNDSKPPKRIWGKAKS